MVEVEPRVVTQRDMDEGMRVPLNWLKILPPFQGKEEIILKVTDGVGFYWEFCCCVYKQYPWFYAHLRKTNGWEEFVNYKRLRVSDRVVLDCVENEFRGTKYRLRAQKRNHYGVWIDV